MSLTIADSNTNTEIETLSLRLDDLLNTKVKGAQIRAKADFIELGEKSTKFFFKKEKINCDNKLIERLLINGNEVTEPKKILKELHNYFSKVFTSKLAAFNGDFDSIFLNNNIFMPKLDEEAKIALDVRLTLLELETAMKEMLFNKTPGSDGIPVEFYILFWEKIKYYLLDSINAALIKGSMSQTQKEGIINLLRKKDKDSLFLKNWRPLTMLNVDYKILAKTLANRIKTKISTLIHSDQTGFLKNRYIGENINRILSIMEYCEKNDLEGLIVNIDFEKAFDSIEWNCLYKTLSFFNFGENFIGYIKTLYNGSFAKVMNNGWASEPIQLGRGLRQGCPLSPYLFILVAELLSNNIRNNRNIKGICINNYEHKICQFADDTENIISFDENSLREIMLTLDNFESFSGLKVNSDKTEILKIGKSKFSNVEFLPQYKFKWKNNIKTLGVELWNELSDT